MQASAAKGPGKGFGAWPTSPSKPINVATPVPGPASAAKAAVQASAAKGPGKGFGAWPTALPAAEEGLRPDSLTSPSKPIRKDWETAPIVATPGPASAAKAAAQASKKELGDSSQRGHARPGFGSQGCGAGICSQRSRKGLWSLANGPAGCRGGFETGPPNVTFETHKKELGDSSQRGHARPGFGSQGCGASIRSQRSREGLWSLANGPAGCRGGFETGQEPLVASCS